MAPLPTKPPHRRAVAQLNSSLTKNHPISRIASNAESLRNMINTRPQGRRIQAATRPNANHQHCRATQGRMADLANREGAAAAVKVLRTLAMKLQKGLR